MQMQVCGRTSCSWSCEPPLLFLHSRRRAGGSPAGLYALYAGCPRAAPLTNSRGRLRWVESERGFDGMYQPPDVERSERMVRALLYPGQIVNERWNCWFV